MLVQALRKTAVPALLGLVVALSIVLPSTAHADEAAPQDSATHQMAFSTVLSTCDSFAQDTKTDLVIDMAKSLEGSPYAYGGTTPRGFDCSGFTSYCFREAIGMELPRTAAGQAALGKPVSMDQLQTGDLLFWGSGGGVYHVGIYLEGNTYIHAAGSGKGVRIQTMDYFHPTFAKRII